MTSQNRRSFSPFAGSSTTRTSWFPQLQNVLRPLFDKLAKELDLFQRARAAGIENLPATDDRDLDEAQRSVLVRVQEGSNLLNQFLAAQLTEAERLVRDRRPEALTTDLALAEARQAAIEARTAHRENLIAAHVEERRKLRGLRKFRADNRLSRDAAYAENRGVPATWMLLLLVVETIANALLFQKVNPLGFVGGFFQALLFGSVNVALGFGLGFLGLRLINHVQLRNRVFGFLIAASGLSLGLWWNMLVSRYREALERNPGSGLLDLIKGVPAADWLQLSSAESWALLLLGLVIFAIACVKGIGGRGGFEDAYWGYRASDLAHREAATLYADAKENYRAEVQAAIARARQSLRDRLHADREKLGQIRNIANQVEERVTEVHDSLHEWVKAGGALLRRYREENLAVRTMPAPAYFAVYPDLADIARTPLSAVAIRGMVIDAEQRVNASEAAVATAETAIAEMAAEELATFLQQVENAEQAAAKQLIRDWAAEEPDHGDASPHAKE